MSKPPPEDLMEWPKAELAKEVARLRAINREFADRPHDDATSGGGITDVAGDPHARGGVILDARGAVLMDTVDVSLIDTKKEEERPAMFLVIGGRVNFETRRTSQAFMFGADGAAGLATELIALAGRAGGDFFDEFRESFTQRMGEMP
jgi:hypothetical protein